ncbi:hypothetical protein EV356DRAFT_495813 [Viridothelium virens]|uniref:Uncharacterized protein n=1 Tax=Viridothelium virens TaxID=1048519 RepID=A0A6A6HPE4_VIRVR|nr:hypothetical protein EV356DRAFT_495813 [Viridothelium virens]
MYTPIEESLTKKCTTKVPWPPLTLKQSAVGAPQWEIVSNGGLNPQSNTTIEQYSAQVQQRFNQGNLRVPLPPSSMDPFTHKLGLDPQSQLVKLQDLQDLIESTGTNTAQPMGGRTFEVTAFRG